MTQQIMGVSDLAKFLGISRGMIYKLVRNKQIPYFQIGNRTKFQLKDIEEWASQGGTTGDASLEWDEQYKRLRLVR